MTEENTQPNQASVLKVPAFWVGIAFALGGFLAEEFTGGEHAFEVFMLFGGLFLGGVFERQRSAGR